MGLYSDRHTQTAFRGAYQGEGIWYACPTNGTPREIDDRPAFARLLRDVSSEIGQSSAGITRAFGMDGPGEWRTFEDEGLFRFSAEGGGGFVAPYGVAGSWNAETHSWYWTWAMPDGWVAPAARTAAERLHAHADRAGWEAGQHGLLYVNEYEAWRMAKLTAHVSGLPLVYRAKVNELNWHYFAIGAPSRLH